MTWGTITWNVGNYGDIRGKSDECGHLISHILQLHRETSVGLQSLDRNVYISRYIYMSESTSRELLRVRAQELRSYWNGTLIDSNFPNGGCIFHIDFDNGCPFLLVHWTCTISNKYFACSGFLKILSSCQNTMGSRVARPMDEEWFLSSLYVEKCPI